MSATNDRNSGVPQGSIIGPRVFTMYAQPLISVRFSLQCVDVQQGSYP